MRDFLERAHLLHRDTASTVDHVAFDTVFRAISKLQAVHSKATLDLDNLEAVFGTLEMARVIGLFPEASPADITLLYSSFKKVIAQTLEESIQFKVSDGQIQPSGSYAHLARLLFKLRRSAKPRSYSIITFNYDVALDYALNFHNVPIDYCLEASDANPTVAYLKLHGSLNWVQTKVSDRVVSWPAAEWLKGRMLAERNFSGFKILISRRLASQHPPLGGEEYDPEPVIIPPTWNKLAYQGNLANVWRRAARELSDAKEIYVSGYSLVGTDAYFRYLFALGAIGPSRIRRFIVADPDPSHEVEARFREVLGQDTIKKLEFRRVEFSALLNIAEQSLSEK